MKKLLILHGSYFGDNFGDRLFVEIFLDWANNYDGINMENISIPFAGKRIREASNCSKIRGVRALLSSKCIVFIGGGYFGEFKANSLVWNIRLIIRHLSIALFARFFKRPYIFIGIGAGPLSNIISRKLVVYVCNKSVKVIVRDNESKEYLIKYGVNPQKVQASVDTVLGLPVYTNHQKIDDKVRIGVHLAFALENKNIEAIIKDLKEFTTKIDDYEIIYFKDFYKEGFSDYSKEVTYREFDADKITNIEYENPKQLINEIGKCNIVITNKLHVGIVALTQNVFTVSVAIHQKTKRLYKQLNLSEYSIPMDNYQKGSINRMLDKWEEKKQVIPKDIISMAENNKQIFYEFIRTYYDK